MFHSNNMPGYNTLAATLTEQGIGMTPAEMHGLISGILCGGEQDKSWQTLVQEIANDGATFSKTLNQPLEQMHRTINVTLQDDNFDFQLLLPDDDNASVYDRADALAGWVNHFLLGLGVTQPHLDKITGELGEALDDLKTIGQLGYDDEEDKEELEESLEEVIEYVRVAALLCHETFRRGNNKTVDKGKPVLH